MILKVEQHYFTLTAESIEEGAKLGIAATQFQILGRDIHLLAYQTMEIPLPAIKPIIRLKNKK